MMILQADPSDAEHLTDLALRSKAFWGYDASQMNDWRDELSVSQNYIEKHGVYKLVAGDQIQGFYAFVKVGKSQVLLDFFFIEPESIGKGYGSLLLEDFFLRVRSNRPVSVTLEADPNAQDFYSARGFKTIGQKKMAIKDRYLPVMELILEKL